MSALWGFHVHTISYFIIYATFFGLWRRHIYPCQALFTRVYFVGKCGESRRIVLRVDVISIRLFINETTHSDRNSRQNSLTPLCNSVSLRDMSTSKYRFGTHTCMIAQYSLLKNGVAFSVIISIAPTYFHKNKNL